MRSVRVSTKPLALPVSAAQTFVPDALDFHRSDVAQCFRIVKCRATLVLMVVRHGATLALAIPAIGGLSGRNIQTSTPPYIIGGLGGATREKCWTETPADLAISGRSVSISTNTNVCVTGLCSISPSTANCEAAIWSRSGSITLIPGHDNMLALSTNGYRRSASTDENMAHTRYDGPRRRTRSTRHRVIFAPLNPARPYQHRKYRKIPRCRYRRY